MNTSYKDSHQLQAQADAMVNFLENWTHLDTLNDIGPKLTCQECEALAMLLYCYGEAEAARVVREAHVTSDDAGDLREHVGLRRQLGLEKEAA